ncbi:hypothetical protein BD769DRAFT_1513767 [Suillus cothurnatus]|nr:hypothetical protein BD769DRAFT_1513767 [Suillus cothurnatus]
MSNMTRKPREKPAPYKQRSETVTKNKDAPATSAKPHKVTTRKNLTLNDWLVSQAEIVLHFENELTGALALSQSALSRALKRRPELEARINSNPNALSSKRPRVVS